MRYAPFIAIGLVALVGCEPQPTSHAGEYTSTLSERTHSFDAMRQEIMLLRNEVNSLKNQKAGEVRYPIIAEVEAPPRRYAITAGPAAGVQHMDAIYPLHVESGRFVAMFCMAENQKIEIVAGRDVAQAVKGPINRHAPPPAVTKPQVHGGAGFTTARGGPDEEVLLVVDEASDRLLVYKLDATRKRLLLIVNEDLKKLFELK